MNGVYNVNVKVDKNVYELYKTCIQRNGNKTTGSNGIVGALNSELFEKTIQRYIDETNKK